MVRISINLLIIAVVYGVFAGFAQMKLNSADASLYLNIAENFSHHKGFVFSYDLYQFFTGLYHPVWPYITPVYPFLCSVVFGLGGGITQVIQVNILLLGINAALVFSILQSLIPTRLNLMFLATLVFSLNFYLTALLPWTEQLHLCLFLLSFILFLRSRDNPRGLLIAGLLNGVLFLTRIAHIYSIAAYLAVIIFSPAKRGKMANTTGFMAGIALVLLPYELISWVKYHAFYPQYVKPAAEYTMARVSALSFYKHGHEGIVNPAGYHFSWGYFGHHLQGFLDYVYWFFVPVIGWAFTQTRKEGRDFVFNALVQSFFIILGYAYNLGWTIFIEPLRYGLVPYVLCAMAGWYALYELAFGSGRTWKKGLVVVLMAFLAAYSFGSFCSERREMMVPRTAEPYFRDLFENYRWINTHLPKEVLIASDETQEGYFMHRPFISLPPERSYTCRNLEMYNRIYKPDYYLLSQYTPDTCFKGIATTPIFTDPTFRLLQVKK